MDTRQVVARFEAERQALALMDHPHIAHVFDGGTTETGRPYFVMELVRGVPITAFCDQSCLGIRQRLELFVDVCQAVQHAHQKGIIHRDIKPTNVMVTLHDGHHQDLGRPSAAQFEDHRAANAQRPSGVDQHRPFFDGWQTPLELQLEAAVGAQGYGRRLGQSLGSGKYGHGISAIRTLRPLGCATLVARWVADCRRRRPGHPSMGRRHGPTRERLAGR
jgi:serine/threonine protein kinase